MRPWVFRARIMGSVYNKCQTSCQNITRVPIIGKHVKFDVLCLHTSIMATDLRLTEELPLNLSPGMVVAFESSIFALPGSDYLHFLETYLDLYNINNDIILRITIRRKENKVFFNDRAAKRSLWGEEQSVNLSPADVNRWRDSGVTISVHDCSTPSKKQYQILFDQTTVYYFDRRFSGPGIKVHYSSVGTLLLPSLSDPLKVYTYSLHDLSVAERQDVESRK